MTLFKQIALILSVFLLIILTTVLILNFKSSNESIQERLYEDARNTASSLSLSLGSANGDISMMSTMINANFDSGDYHHISLVDVDGNTIYDRIEESDILSVPSWFLSIVNITAPIASANVSAGWSQVGILNVESEVTYAYKQLYTILINLLISFGIIFIVSLIILSLLLAAILKPLKEVQRQAEAIMRNVFIIQSDIPSTKEFKDVVLGMNNMVSKVKAMFEKGNEELKHQKELEYIDKDTNLKNRKYLIDKLPEYLKIDASLTAGINMMIALNGVIEANKKIGHKEVDKLFLAMANMFYTNAANYKNSIVSRMNGTEFAIFLPGCSQEEGITLAKKIYNSYRKIAKNFDLDEKETYLSIGLYNYNHKESIAQVLSHSDNALAQAKFNENNIYLEESETAIEVMGKEAWRGVINNAIKENKFKLTSWAVVDVKKKKISHKVLSLALEVDKKTTYSYGQFMASANQVGLSSKIYQNALNMIFKTPNTTLKNSTCSLRLSYEYLQEQNTYDEMSALIHKYASSLSFKLIIEMPDKLVRQNSSNIKQYKKLFEEFNIEMGIFEFIGESTDYQYLQDIRPIYIKGELNYFINQSQQTLSALRLITDTVGISLIATGVMDVKALNKLEKKDIYIVQGKVTEIIELA